jgi:hypothetical protein
VVCGRGRKVFMHVGNQSFRQMVESRLQEYSNAATKVEKSCIICEMVVHVRTSSPHGGFVKRSSKDGRWYQLRELLSREKTSQALRDAFADQCGSSTNEIKKLRRDRKPHRAVSEGSSQAPLQAQPKHPSANNGAKARSADNLSGGLPAFKDPLPLVTLKKGAGIVSYQPPDQVFSLHNFEWASQNVALSEASAKFIQANTEPAAVIVERNVFERLVLLVDKITDNGDDPFEPNPLPAQGRYAVN